MGSIDGRLRRLEAVSSEAGEPCETCGFDGDFGKLEMVTNVRQVGADEPAPGPERCPGCGRPLVIRLRGMEGDPIGPAA